MPPPWSSRPRHRSLGHRCASRSGIPRGGPGPWPSASAIGAPDANGVRNSGSTRSSQTTLLLLAFLAEDELARIADPLALVRLRRPELPDLGRNLPDLLLVDAGHDDLGRPRALHLDALWN